MSYHTTNPKELLLSFPQMQEVFDRTQTDDSIFSSSAALREWAADGRVGVSANHIVSLVCSVIEGHNTSGGFDVIAAMKQWDALNRKAFKNWLGLAFP